MYNDFNDLHGQDIIIVIIIANGIIKFKIYFLKSYELEIELIFDQFLLR